MEEPPSAARKRVKSRHSSKCRCTDTLTNTFTYDPSNNCTTPLTTLRPSTSIQCHPVEAMPPQHQSRNQ